jgi:hypothetical protein
MEKDRDILELLILMINNIHKIGAWGPSGLCGLSDMLVDNELISDQENNIIMDYIEANKPTNAGDPWWFEPFSIPPREAWLDEQIKKLSK